MPFCCKSNLSAFDIGFYRYIIIFEFPFQENIEFSLDVDIFVNTQMLKNLVQDLNI